MSAAQPYRYILHRYIFIIIIITIIIVIVIIIIIIIIIIIVVIIIIIIIVIIIIIINLSAGLLSSYHLHHLFHRHCVRFALVSLNFT